MNAFTGAMYSVDASVRLHREAKMTTWSPRSPTHTFEYEVLEPAVTFIVLGNVTDASHRSWVCVLVDDCRIGWISRTLFNDGLAYVTKIA